MKALHLKKNCRLCRHIDFCLDRLCMPPPKADKYAKTTKIFD